MREACLSLCKTIYGCGGCRCSADVDKIKYCTCLENSIYDIFKDVAYPQEVKMPFTGEATIRKKPKREVLKCSFNPPPIQHQ